MSAWGGGRSHCWNDSKCGHILINWNGAVLLLVQRIKSPVVQVRETKSGVVEMEVRENKSGVVEMEVRETKSGVVEMEVRETKSGVVEMEVEN